ncbi:galactosyltransferase-related protein [Psychrobacter pygoscelis]|uniref:galactosyltransferase-related protein n=1 Tax=Psychrobacter pygoscelis TaxID=2488563 RepID=UPI0013F3F6E4|nr:galactosyltransferase-related protein [Psychrobacter pygoscelis]
MNNCKYRKYKFTVDIVIPVRDRAEYDVIERLKLRKNYNFPDNFNIFLVDYGSIVSVSNQLKEICLSEGYHYFYVDTHSKLFNLAHARNIAILNSQADYLIFEDIDLISHHNFYIWINQQIQSMIIERHYPLLVVPVVYLSQIYSKILYQPLSSSIYDNIVSEIFDPSSKMVDFFAAASSHIICSRETSKFIGGFDEIFEGWGFEDSDFELRFLNHSNVTKPRDFFKYDSRPYSEQIQWSGWKVLFRVFSDVLAYKGVYSFHIWHPKPKHRSTDIISKNRQIFNDNSKRYSKFPNRIYPLHDISKPTDLFLTDNPLYFNISLFHYFSNPLIIDEKNIVVNDIYSLIMKYSIKSVVFNDLYENTKSEELYFEFERNGVRTYLMGKGALPNSMYVTSSDYIKKIKCFTSQHWENIVSEKQIKETYKYINNYKLNCIQGGSSDNELTANKLRNTVLAQYNKKKILLLIIDSNKNYSENYPHAKVMKYNKFLNEIIKLEDKLINSEWLLVYKDLSKANKSNKKLENIVCVNSYDLNGLMDASNRVVLLDNDAGIYAMIYSKPTYYFSDVFCHLPGVNMKVHDANHLYTDLVNNDFHYNKNLAICFLSYLINNYYSFFVSERLSDTVNIVYNVLRVDAKKVHSNVNPISNLKNSFLFDRYRMDDYLVRNSTDNEREFEYYKKIDSELISRKVQSIDRLNYNIMSNKRYNIKTKLKKLLKNPNQFFADYFIKRINK